MFRTLLCFGFTFAAIQAFTVKRSFCGGGDAFLTVDNGEITSHSGIANGHTYGRNMDCTWRIQAPVGQHVELIAKSFDIENDPTCEYDYLMLYDGSDTSASSLGKFCGSSFAPITSSGNHLTLRFITDGDTQAGGFEIFYNFTTESIHTCLSTQFKCANGKCISGSFRCDNADDCGDDSDEQSCTGVIGGNSSCAADEFACGPPRECVPRSWLCDGDDDCTNGADEIANNCLAPVSSDNRCGNQNITGDHGTLTSPSYPSIYPNNMHCIYFIQAPAGTKTVAFKFADNFHLEPDPACDYDNVIVYSDGKSFKHGPFCGNTSPGQFTMPGDHAYVEFTSDDSDNYAGYSLDWKAIQ